MTDAPRPPSATPELTTPVRRGRHPLGRVAHRVHDQLPPVGGTDLERLRQLVRHCPLPAFLLRLSDSRIVEVSEDLVGLTGGSREELTDLVLLSCVSEPELSRRLMTLLATGALESYTRRGGLRQHDGTYLPMQVRFTASSAGGSAELAVGIVLPSDFDSDPRRAGDGEVSASTLPMAVGTVDGDWRIEQISTDVTSLLLLTPDRILGSRVFDHVHPEDHGVLLVLAGQAPDRVGGATGRVRLRTGDGQWSACLVRLQPVLGGRAAGHVFVVTPSGVTSAGAADQVRRLERHLERIATEVASAGVTQGGSTMPSPAELPELQELSPREYEVVIRLLAGERVAGIAAALFLSESTVRNHLTRVFRKLEVRSQAELIARLRRHRWTTT